MNWIPIILVLALFFLLFKNLKHEIFRKSLKLITILLLVFLVLTLAAYYVDLGQYFNRDSTIIKTGASIVKTVKNNIDDNEFVEKEHIEEVIEKGIDKAKESDFAKNLINK